MKGLLATPVLVVLAVGLGHAAVKPESSPDFWYVTPSAEAGPGAIGAVRGIVVPSASSPTVQTSPTGSTISWLRTDGTRQSFVVRGTSSLRFERGPIDGTTYIAFRKVLQHEPDSCCVCASWENSQESAEALACVNGCFGCGCEGCICSPTFPCPIGPDGSVTLVPNNGSGPTMTIAKYRDGADLTVVDRDTVAARFRGRRLAAGVDASGVTLIKNPDAITLSGPVSTQSSVQDEVAYFSWVSPEASVILTQPRSSPVPAFHAGTITFDPTTLDAPPGSARRHMAEPLMDRCKVCGTHPNSKADLTIYDCVPGESVCYRCISWEC